MALRILIPLGLGGCLFLYLGYLNPFDVSFVYAPGRSLELSFTVLVLFSSFLGAFTLGIFYSFSSLGDYFELLGRRSQRKQSARNAKLLHEAHDLLNAEESKKALKALAKILSTEPKNLEALLLKGDILRREGRLKEALEAHSLAMAFHPADPKPVLRLKEDYLAGGLFDAAYKMLERVREKRPKDIGILTGMREIVEKTRDIKRAVVLQKEIVKYTSNQSSAQAERQKLAELLCKNAESMLEKGDESSAKRELNTARKIYPDFLPATMMLASVFLKETRVREAEKVFKKEFGRTNSIPILQKLARIYRETGREENIEKLYRWALTVVDGTPLSKYIFPFIFTGRIENGDFEGAEETLAEIEKHFGETAFYSLALGVLRLGTADGNTEAATALKKALLIERGEFVRYQCGRCGHLEGDYFASCPACGAWNSASARFRK